MRPRHGTVSVPSELKSRGERHSDSSCIRSLHTERPLAQSNSCSDTGDGHLAEYTIPVV